MKIKAITSVTKLNSGLYIRAFVNYVGDYMVLVENVVGKPYKDKNESDWSRNLWRVQTKGTWNQSKRYEAFVGDLLGHNQAIANSILLPYSAEIKVKLASIDKFQFLELINRRELSSEEVADLIHDWSYQSWSNDEMDKSFDEEYDRYVTNYED